MQFQPTLRQPQLDEAFRQLNGLLYARLAGASAPKRQFRPPTTGNKAIDEAFLQASNALNSDHPATALQFRETRTGDFRTDEAFRQLFDGIYRIP